MSNTNHIEITVPESTENLHFVNESKAAAKTHEWLYHCTSVKSLISIINSREMWLSNLKDVNDREEANRIDMPEFEKAYYIASFTYDPNIPREHWAEYGKSEESVLFGVKQTWFTNKVHFLDENHKKELRAEFQIVNRFEKTFEYRVTNHVYPYLVFNHGFYQVQYSNDLVKKMKSAASMDANNIFSCGSIVITALPGIIKSEHGRCTREGMEPYDKNWKSEKEVRLKFGVATREESLINSGDYLHQMAVELSDTAFSELPLRFSPDMSEKQKKQSMEQIRGTLSKKEAHIYEI